VPWIFYITYIVYDQVVAGLPTGIARMYGYVGNIIFYYLIETDFSVITYRLGVGGYNYRFFYIPLRLTYPACAIHACPSFDNIHFKNFPPTSSTSVDRITALYDAIKG